MDASLRCTEIGRYVVSGGIMLFKRIAMLATGSIMLCACGVQRENIKDTSSIPSGSGVLLSHIVLVQTNYWVAHKPLELGIIKNGGAFASVIYPVDKSSTYAVTVLPAGHYSWKGMHIDGVQSSTLTPTFGDRHADLEGLLPFEVRAGQVNYIGDIVINIDWSAYRYRLQIADRTDWAKSFMNVLYPKLLASYPFVTNLTKDER